MELFSRSLGLDSQMHGQLQECISSSGSASAGGELAGMLIV